MMEGVRIIVRGNVQGVYFRASCQKVARDLKLVGSVENLDNGSVQISAQGDSSSLQNLIRWCTEGPELAEVESCEIMNLDQDLMSSEFIIKF